MNPNQPYRLPAAAVARYKQMMDAQPVRMALPAPPPRFPTPGRMDGVRSFAPKMGSLLGGVMAGVPAMFGGR